jgi:hypothetical protein
MDNAIRQYDHSEPLERRSGDTRHCALMRTAKLVGLTGEYLCIVQDVSANGVKVRLFHAFPPETHLFLELANGMQFAIERRWMDGPVAGFRFAAPIDVGDFIRETSLWGKRPVRLRMNGPGELIAGGERSHVMLVNLSRQGACIEAGSQFAVGRVVRLAIHGIPPRVGHVCWRRGYAHGVVFQEAFAPQDLARFALDLQPFSGHAGEGDEQALCA